MTGSEMIEELSTRSGGDWQPTATTIYPTLQMLEDDALVATGQSDDGRRRYSLTDAGTAEVERIDARSSRMPWEAPASETPADLLVAIAETARVLVGAAAAANDEQKADLVALLEDVRRRIAAIVPETRARSGGQGWPGWPIKVPDWVFGGGGGGTAAEGAAPGPFGRNWRWWLGGEGDLDQEHGSASSWDVDEDDGEDDDDQDDGGVPV